MRNARFIGLCLLIVFGLCAVASATASAAEPALYECAKVAKVEKKYHGKYVNKTCTEESKTSEGKYELQEGIGKGKEFKGKGTAANLEIHGLGEVSCKKTADTGYFTSPKTAGKINVTFTGCEINGRKCSSEKAAAGEIKTNPLQGEVGYIEGKGTSSPVIGVALSAEPPYAYEAVFTCNPEELNARVSGAVIGVVKAPYNKFTKEATLTFSQSSGKQEPESFEGGPTQTLLTEAKFGGMPEPPAKASAESVEVKNKGEELMVKACPGIGACS